MGEYEASWMRASDAKIDYRIIPFDVDRAIEEDPETMIWDGLGIAMLRRYARISRGTFKPRNVREERKEKWRKGKDEEELWIKVYHSLRLQG